MVSSVITAADAEVTVGRLAVAGIRCGEQIVRLLQVFFGRDRYQGARADIGQVEGNERHDAALSELVQRRTELKREAERDQP